MQFDLILHPFSLPLRFAPNAKSDTMIREKSNHLG